MKFEQGNTIIVTMIVIATFAGLISVSFDFTTATDRNGKRAQAYQSATNIADGLLDQAFQVWKTTSQKRVSVTELTSDDLKATIASYTPVSASVAANAKGFYYTQDLTNDAQGFKKDFKITHIDGFGIDVTGANTLPTIGASAGYRNYYYKAHVGVSVPIRDIGGQTIHVESNRYFVKRFQSPWNFAIFYNDDLELNPGQDMIVNGWIHSNGTMYTGNNVLHMMGRITYVEGYEANFAPGEARRIASTDSFPTGADIYKGGTDLVTNLPVANGYLDNWTSTSPPAVGEKQQVIDISADAFNASSSGTYGTNDDGYQEIIQVKNPSFPDPPAIAQQRIVNKADIFVEIGGSATTPTVTVKKKSGVDANGYSIFTTATDATLASGFATGKTVRDNRWGGSVDVTDVDISNFTARSKLNSTDPKYVAGGATLYVYDSRGDSTTKKGIRLVRGASLPDDGLTVVSQNPIYIQGDYNTNGTYTTTATTDRVPLTQPLSNAAIPDQTKPSLNGPQKSAAVIGDAITILSNAWNDTTTNTTGAVTPAAKTTVNAAFLTGNVPTKAASGSAPATYSGGAENFPRFLESWTGVEFTYWGSMVQMFQSQQANEPWGKPNVYDAPKRRWNFDSRLVNYPPPGTPRLVSYSKIAGRWFLQ